MSILIFVPLTLLAAIAERPRRRSAYRKRSGTEFHNGRSY